MSLKEWNEDLPVSFELIESNKLTVMRAVIGELRAIHYPTRQGEKYYCAGCDGQVAYPCESAIALAKVKTERKSK